MAPVRSSSRRGVPQTLPVVEQTPPQTAQDDANAELFIDPMLGTPLSLYIEKDVEGRDELVRLVTAYGGTISPSYSGVTYILVDPHKTSGQNLFRQYASKKTKLVLDARWIRECVRANRLQTFAAKWAGCKVTGEEEVYPPGYVPPVQEDTPMAAPEQPQQPQASTSSQATAAPPAAVSTPPTIPPQPAQVPPPVQLPLPAQPPPPVQAPPPAHAPPPVQPPHPPVVQAPPPVQAHPPVHMPYPMPITAAVVADPLAGFPQSSYSHPMHAPSPHIMTTAPPPWPPMPHMIRPPTTQPYRDEHPWPDYSHQGAFAGEYRYREHNPPWLPSPSSAGFYDPSQQFDPRYPPPFIPDPSPGPEPEPAPAPEPAPEPAPATVSAPPPAPAVEDPSSSSAEPSAPQPEDVAPTVGTLEPPERGRRPRKQRPRMQPMPAIPAENLVNRPNRSSSARSPTPPARVIKSTYGGNLFTADDVLYLKKYIDYCQGQGLVLSLREICERIAVKAPHHTFFSWRRYCNKHQIRLGGYEMSAARGNSPTGDDGGEPMDIEEEPGADAVRNAPAGPSAPRFDTAAARAAAAGPRNRSPTPPRALYRSTTGKGVAFTQEDVDFLMNFLRYRETQGTVDATKFWKDVATKAPHHSRASWMKFWRRHKHELVRGEHDDALPPPPEKKVRYSREDDILLAKFFFTKPEGTSDQLFQNFARSHPHHPWKGWQEHYRIHKTKIDHFVEQLQAGEDIEAAET